jgi:hypothetical protein
MHALTDAGIKTTDSAPGGEIFEKISTAAIRFHPLIRP